MAKLVVKKIKKYMGVILFALTIFIMLQCANYNTQEINKRESMNQSYIVEKR